LYGSGGGGGEGRSLLCTLISNVIVLHLYADKLRNRNL
jgi:hypothetical protein